MVFFKAMFAIIILLVVRDGYFTLIVFLLPCACKCSRSLSHRALGWSAVCDCLILSPLPHMAARAHMISASKTILDVLLV